MVFQIVHRDCRNHNRRFLRSLGFALVNKEILEDIGAVQRVVHTEVDTFENICHTILVNKGLYNLKLVPGDGTFLYGLPAGNPLPAPAEQHPDHPVACPVP